MVARTWQKPPTMDRIIISDLSTRCIIGVNEDERNNKQDVLINLSIYGDFQKAGQSDRIEHAIDYRALKKRVLELVELSKHFLLEALAEAVADTCLESPGVHLVRVRIDKPTALRFARSVGVEIERKKPS